MNDDEFETDLPSHGKIENNKVEEQPTEDLKVEELIPPLPDKNKSNDIGFLKLDKEITDVIFVVLSSLLAHNDIVSALFNSVTDSDTISFILQCIISGVIFYSISLFYKRI